MFHSQSLFYNLKIQESCLLLIFSKRQPHQIERINPS